VLYAVTGDEQYARWYQLWWGHIATIFIDPAHGE
jgi:mannose/cellobiose epimerase-like protein (N-acyl-D-glucosamine 2-epimerase family)